MGQSLNCFAKTSSLTLAGDLSGFPDGFEGESYHRTEDPYKDSRLKFEHGYKATFYSNKDEDKHILVHDHYIGFEIGKGFHRQCPNNHVYNKTMKVEGNTLRVEPTIVNIIIRNDTDTDNNGTYTKDKFDKTLQRYIYIGPIRKAYFNNNLVIIGDKTKRIDYGFLSLGTVKNDTMTIGTKPVEDTKTVEDANTGWRSSNGGLKF